MALITKTRGAGPHNHYEKGTEMAETVWESTDENGDRIWAARTPNSKLIRLEIGSTRYYLTTEERKGLAAFLLDGLDDLGESLSDYVARKGFLGHS